MNESKGHNGAESSIAASLDDNGPGMVAIKVSEVTRERVRLGAAICGVTQAEFVARAVNEWLENHRGDFRDRVERAREALLGDDEAMLRYLRGDRG